MDFSFVIKVAIVYFLIFVSFKGIGKAISSHMRKKARVRSEYENLYQAYPNEKLLLEVESCLPNDWVRPMAILNVIEGRLPDSDLEDVVAQLLAHANPIVRLKAETILKKKTT